MLTYSIKNYQLTVTATSTIKTTLYLPLTLWSLDLSQGPNHLVYFAVLTTNQCKCSPKLINPWPRWTISNFLRKPKSSSSSDTCIGTFTTFLVCQYYYLDEIVPTSTSTERIPASYLLSKLRPSITTSYFLVSFSGGPIDKSAKWPSQPSYSCYIYLSFQDKIFVRIVGRVQNFT